MDATTAARSNNDDLPRWGDDTMMGVEVPIEIRNTTNTSGEACNSVNLLTGQDLAWDYSLPTLDALRSSSVSSSTDSKISPRSTLSDLYPHWQIYQQALAPLLAHSSDHPKPFSSESEEFWQGAQGKPWSLEENNLNSWDGVDTGQLIWPNFNIDHSQLDDLAFVSYTSYAAECPEMAATIWGSDAFTELAIPATTDTGASSNTVLDSAGGQQSSQTIQQQLQQPFPTATTPHPVYAPSSSSTIPPIPRPASSASCRSAHLDLEGTSSCYAPSPRQPDSPETFSATAQQQQLQQHYQHQRHQQQQGITSLPTIGNLPASPQLCLPPLRPRRPSSPARTHGVPFAYYGIMPLGASITNGKPTPEGTHGNSYRRALRDKLRFEGWKVNMVGSQPNGEMNDNVSHHGYHNYSATVLNKQDNEGYPGYRVAEITKVSRAAQERYHPNLILINAGTNDAVQGFNVDTTGERMEALINQCFSLTPETVVILSTLIPCQANERAPGNVDNINQQYRNLAARLQKQGYHIMLAEMHDGFLTMDDIDPKDHTHPFESGDRKMAAVWSYAFDEVVKEKWLKAPRHMDEFSDDATGGTTCPKTYGSGRIDTSDKRQGMEVLTAGSHRIVDDGRYVHDAEHFGALNADGAKLYAKIQRDGGHKWHLAQLYNAGAPRGKELDDLVTIEGKDATSMVVYINRGKGNFDNKVDINVYDSCLDRGIRWGDIDGDGLDDFICIGRDGDIAASRNMGGNPPTFKYLGGIKSAAKGYKQNNVRLGDIDGDGRLDYCVIHDNDDIHCWRNGGLGEKPAYWQDMGVIFFGKNMGDIDGVRFVDINGDGKDDWLWVDPKDGSITTWINQRGFSKSMRPYWKKAGKTHAGMGSIQDGPDQILLGRVFGSGRADVSDVSNSLDAMIR